MKYYLSLILVNILIFSHCKAQYKGKPKEFSVSTGISVPVTEFKEKNFFGSRGFANVGISFNSELNLYYWKVLGIGVSFHSALNGINKKELENWYNEALYQKVNASVKAGDYFINSVMIYPIFIDLRGKKMIFQIKSGIGVSFCRHPYVKVSDNTYGRIVKINSDWGKSTTTGSSIIFSYLLSDTRQVLLGYNMYYLIPGFTNDLLPENLGYKDYYDLEMRHYTINLGYVYHF